MRFQLPFSQKVLNMVRVGYFPLRSWVTMGRAINGRKFFIYLELVEYITFFHLPQIGDHQSLLQECVLRCLCLMVNSLRYFVALVSGFEQNFTYYCWQNILPEVIHLFSQLLSYDLFSNVNVVTAAHSTAIRLF